MNAPDLLMPLLVFASDASMREKNAASRELESAVRARFGRQLASLCAGCFEDAVQHLLHQALRAKFHGRTIGEAYVWCRTVLRAFCISDLKARRRIDEVGADMDATGDLGDEQRLLRLGEGALRKLRAHIAATQRGPTVATQIDCFIHRRTGGGIEEALERWGGDPRPTGPVERTKAAARIYNYRRKGEALARAAFAALTANGLLDDEEQRFLAALLSATEDEADGGGPAPS